MNSIGNHAFGNLKLPLTERLLGSTKDRPGTQQLGELGERPSGFASLLSQGVQQVNSQQQDAAGQVHELLTGGDVSQVEVFSAVQKADMAFRMLVQVRNKLISAYEEINAIRV